MGDQTSFPARLNSEKIEEPKKKFNYIEIPDEARQCLPSNLQHSLLDIADKVLCKTFFDFITEQDPTYLEEHKIFCPADVQLNYWPENLFESYMDGSSAMKDIHDSSVVLEEKIGGQPEGSQGSNNLDSVLRRICEIRHSTTHSIKHDVRVVKDMIVDASRVAWSLRDYETFRLLKSTLDVLNSAILHADGSGNFKEEDMGQLEASITALEVAIWSAQKRKLVLAQVSLAEQ